MEKTNTELRAECYTNSAEICFPANSTDFITVDDAVKFYNRYRAIGNDTVADYLQGEIIRATDHIKQMYP